MIKRERYLGQIRPFIGSELVKVFTGIRRSGKSVMLELIREELATSDILDTQFISFNFEEMSNFRLCTAESFREEILKRAEGIEDKVYLFFDEIQEVKEWEQCVNLNSIKNKIDFYRIRFV